jgi:hypothetical protein
VSGQLHAPAALLQNRLLWKVKSGERDKSPTPKEIKSKKIKKTITADPPFNIAVIEKF